MFSYNYQIPGEVRHGFGRLIRTNTDRPIQCVLTIWSHAVQEPLPLEIDFFTDESSIGCSDIVEHK